MVPYRRLVQFGLLLLLFALPASATAQPGQVQAPTAPRSNAGAVVPGQYLVLVNAGFTPEEVSADHALSRKYTYRAAGNGFAAHVPPGTLAALRADPRIKEIVPDRIVAVPPLIAQDMAATGKPSGGGTSTGQVIPEGVKRIGAAPGALSQTGNAIGVAIVDTGVGPHADLNLSPTCYFSTEVATSCQDQHGHGTHVGGIVAARNDSTGVVGVASNATLYAARVLGADGYGTDSAITDGFNWIAANAALVSPRIRVVNVSLGRPGTLNDNALLHDAVKKLYDLGITVVVAAGNDPGLEVSQQVPATYPEVLAVASTTAIGGSKGCFGISAAGDTASFFTTDGKYDGATKIGVTVSAPGEDRENVSGCYLSSEGILSLKLGGGTTRMSGTSMAAPHVTGVAALVYEKTGGSTSPEDMRSRMRSGAARVGAAPLDSPAAGYTPDGEKEGILSATGALQ
jgi:subtilisin